MASERKPVTIHYRKFAKPDGVTATLEAMIRSAMDSNGPSGSAIKNRYLERLYEQGNDSLFINWYTDSDDQTTFVFGDILHFTKGHLQALCQTADDTAELVPVHQLRAPEQSEYVHSEMFWMVKDDHAFIVQSMSLKTAEFEEYLSWLLKDKTSILPVTAAITLNAKFDVEEVGGDLEDIQEIIIGGVATQPPTMPEQPEQTVERVSEVTQTGQIDTGRRTGWATARKILSELLGGDANVAALMETVPPDAELNVQVHIGFQTKKRKIDRVALAHLETGLRNLPDSQLQVRAKGGKIGSDGSIRLHHNASIRLIKAQDGDNQIIGTLLDPADVQRATVEAYSNFVANGKIPE